MNLKEYQQEAKRTLPDLENEDLNILHMLLGMQTEVAELADIWKKKIAYKKAVDWINVKEEFGDLNFYLANFCNITGLSWENSLDINIQKLKIRYPDKFSTEQALNRNLKEERKTLEQ